MKDHAELRQLQWHSSNAGYDRACADDPFLCAAHQEKLGYHVGVTLVIKTLRGSKDQRIQQLGLDQLSTYGLMREMSQGQIRTRIDILMLEGLLRVNPLHSTLEPAGDASAVLFGKKESVHAGPFGISSKT